MYTSIIASQLIAIIALIVACFAITGHISYRNKVGITRHVDLNLEYNETTNRYEGEFTLEANEYLDHFYIVTGEHSGSHEIILEVTDGVTDGVSLGASSNTVSTVLHKSNKSLVKNSILKVKDLKASQKQLENSRVKTSLLPPAGFKKEKSAVKQKIILARAWRELKARTRK